MHYRHHCAPHGAQAVVQGAGQHQPQLFCSLEMETGAGSIMQSVLPTSRGSPAACRNLPSAHPHLTFVGIFRRWPIRMALFTMLWWERVAPLGLPVVP